MIIKYCYLSNYLFATLDDASCEEFFNFPIESHDEFPEAGS